MHDYDQYQQENFLSRRRMLARSAELASVVPLGVLAYQDFTRSREVHQYDMSKAKMAENPIAGDKMITDFFNKQTNYTRAVDELYSVYDDEYYKSRVVINPSVDSQGDVTMDYDTEYYWDVPGNLPDESEIGSWINRNSAINGKINYVSQNKLVDINLLKNIAIKAKEGNTTAQKIIAGFIYTAQIGLLLGYEEVICQLEKPSYQSFKQAFNESQTKKQENRRSFFKVGAALAGAFVAGYINRGIDENIKSGREKLEDSLAKAKNNAKKNGETAINSYFNNSLDGIINSTDSQLLVVEDTLKKRINENNVRNAFSRVLACGRELNKSIRALKENRASMDNLQNVSKAAEITQNLEKASSLEERKASLGIILEGLGVAGVMAAILIPAEIYNRKNP